MNTNMLMSYKKPIIKIITTIKHLKVPDFRNLLVDIVKRHPEEIGGFDFIYVRSGRPLPSPDQKKTPFLFLAPRWPITAVYCDLNWSAGRRYLCMRRNLIFYGFAIATISKTISGCFPKNASGFSMAAYDFCFTI